jgi:predicted RNase H-like HicB family nuclease
MRIEVELTRAEDGLYHAMAVLYPEVKATGRTETEALSLLVEAVERHMREQARKAGGPP